MSRSRLLALTLFGLACFLALGAGLSFRAIYDPEWLQYDSSATPAVLRPWPVEADCYSQLARDQRILHGDGLVQNHFKVENWPEGLTPSTTSPFDYAILLLYFPLKLATIYPLDWAGALVSPVLFVALIAFWIFAPLKQFNLRGRAILVVGTALLPVLAWATAFGRSKHISFTLVLTTLALTLEFERWAAEGSARKRWNLWAGAIWGLACWSSLYEPVLLLTLVLGFNAIVRRKENLHFLLSFGVVMLIALLVEGVHVYIPPAEVYPSLTGWFASIPEMQPVFPLAIFQQMTLVLLFAPFLAWALVTRKGPERAADILIIVLLGVLLVLFSFQSRWYYYAAMAEIFLVARYCQYGWMWDFSKVGLVAVFLFGLVDADLGKIQTLSTAPANQPSVELARIARAIDQPGGILAPWWLSPALLYCSAQPIVAGSSHCGISGIVDSARFFSTDSWIDAEALLKKRQVRWVVIWDDRTKVYPVLNNSREILGLPDLTDDDKGQAIDTMSERLNTDQLLPRALQLRAVTPSLKLYEYVPDAGN